MNEYEQNLLNHIQQRGCSVTSVFDPDGEDPPYSYSIGIAKSCGAPELIIVGLSSKLGHALVNLYNDRAQAGERFVPGVPYAGFLEGFTVQFVPVTREHREVYMLSACWLHSGPDFGALQLVWPSTEGTGRGSQRLLSGSGPISHHYLRRRGTRPNKSFKPNPLRGSA